MLGLDRTTVPTNGGAEVAIDGTSFGLCDGNTNVKVLWGPQKSVDVSRVEDFDGRSLSVRAGGVLTGSTGGDCPLGPDPVRLVFPAPEMTGANVSALSVRLSSSRLAAPLFA